MKNLILVRHGKSSWDFDVNDRDRPLKLRGIKDGHTVANVFKTKAGLKPDKIFTSPANRALHTCMIICRNLEYPLENVDIQPELYDFSGERLMRFVKGLEDSLQTVAVFGHNYALTNVANQWGNRHLDNVPTSGLVHIKFPADRWASLEKGSTELVLFPKELR
ncbi:MAG: histidine phosphatase family protein [Eudoraea sp.]|nr:histidine phosphatase family protein [Eudoraea sp.]NNJ39363.1 histidine phosphatase family protein [Eudoraea sp.]